MHQNRHPTPAQGCTKSGSRLAESAPAGFHATLFTVPLWPSSDSNRWPARVAGSGQQLRVGACDWARRQTDSTSRPTQLPGGDRQRQT